MTDGKIIELFWARDESAIREFERQYKSLCMKLARDITGDAGTAEECVNDLCLRLWNSIPPERPLSLRSYACRIVRNLALRWIEKQNAKKRSAVLVELDEFTADLPDMDEGEIGAAVDEFLETLPPIEAKLFVRRYYYSEPVRNIAARLGISENRASKLLARMRKGLGKMLMERGITL